MVGAQPFKTGLWPQTSECEGLTWAKSSPSSSPPAPNSISKPARRALVERDQRVHRVSTEKERDRQVALQHEIVGATDVIQPVCLHADMLHAAHAGDADVSEAVRAAVVAVELRLGPAVLAHVWGRAAEQLEAQDRGGEFLQLARQHLQADETEEAPERLSDRRIIIDEMIIGCASVIDALTRTT